MPWDTQARELSTAVRRDEHVLGPPDAPVTVVMYADFECPYSARAYRVLQGAFHAWPTKMRIIYRHLPKTDKHPDALQAARAAEFAAERDRFWEMADILFDHQDHLSLEDIGMYLRTLDLSEGEFRLDEGGEAVYHRIYEDRQSARKNSVESTPAIFINGRRFENDDDEYRELGHTLREMIYQKFG